MLGVLAENILCVLTFHTDEARIIRGAVDVALYGGPYRLIAARIYDYLDRYHKAPGDHLADLLEDKLSDPKEGQLYKDILMSLHALNEGLNVTYVMSQVETYVKRQSLRTVAVDLAKALQKDTEASLEEADALIRKANRNQISIFDAGTRLSDKSKALGFLNIQDHCFPTGIQELDQRGFGPTRKELWLFIANTKGGKSWALIHLAKMALSQRLRVCPVSLEMSEARCAQRYFQA